MDVVVRILETVLDLVVMAVSMLIAAVAPHEDVAVAA